MTLSLLSKNSLVVSCSLLFLVAAGCGGSDDSSPADGADGTVDTTGETGADADADPDIANEDGTAEVPADVVDDVPADVPEDVPVEVPADVPGEDGGGGTCTGSHTDEMPGGICHMVGKNDPLANCTACHGADLTGGAGPSCYTCHDASDHTSSRGGRNHRPGSSSSCEACHGPDNTGGLGPACSDCH